ncbi:MAG: glycoside hydrolase family protein [Alphaproteobacteria bacterium]|jgi:lysozyme|nr:glycoside hydrolase family protein [Alphaproteobacteria bacterium]
MDNDILKQDLINDEGLKLKPYRDSVGKLTIGVGRNLDDEGITEAEALYLLNNDIQRVETELASVQYFPQLSDIRQRVLIEMTFNMGRSGVMEFKEMWSAIEAQDWNGAADAMLNSEWANEVGQRAVRLATCMRTG